MRRGVLGETKKDRMGQEIMGFKMWRPLLCTALILSVCSGGAVRAREAEKTEVVVAIPAAAEPREGFDPICGWGVGEQIHEQLIQSTLFRTNRELAIENDLATGCSCSEDGLTWTVEIRDDVRFTDGEPLTAGDVAFTYNSCRDRDQTGTFAALRRAVAVDDRTVEFYMNRPFSLWPYTMTYVGIVPEHAYSEEYGERPIGSGPYRLVRWDRGSEAVFEANPDYYDEEPKIMRLTVLFLEKDEALAAAEEGRADVVQILAEEIGEEIGGYHLERMDTVDNYGFSLACCMPEEAEDGTVRGSAFTGSVLVRRAINLAIDREKIVADVLRGCGEPAYSACDKLPWYSEASEVEYSRKAAGAMLENDGWRPGGDGILEKEGVRAQFTLLYKKEDPLQQALAEEVAAQLLKIGIEVRAEGADAAAACARAQTDARLLGCGSYTPMELYDLYHTDPATGRAKYLPYANAAVDAYMDEALAAVNIQEGYELWQNSQWDGTTGVTQEGDIPWIWLCNVQHLYFVRDGLKLDDQKIHPHEDGWSLLNDANEWEWE